jgi:hypothetical protein
MNDDDRCCGSGTCLINADGECWCGQRWDGQKMCTPQRISGMQSDGKPTEGALASPLPD